MLATPHAVPADHSQRLLDILLPEGGVVVALVEAYYDESGTDAESRYIVIAGYLFRSEKAAALSLHWRKALDKYGLTYFRMSSCAVDPGFGQFANLTKHQRIEIAKTCIDLIKSHAEFGFAISVEKEFAHAIPTFGYWESLYTFVCWSALFPIKRWVLGGGYTGDVAYFYEDGHGTKPEANRVLSRILSDPRMKDGYRSAALSFVDKRRVIPVQCADILAWQYLKYRKGLDLGPYKMRKDFESLLELPHTMNHYDEQRIKEFPEFQEQQARDAIRRAQKYQYGRYYF